MLLPLSILVSEKGIMSNLILTDFSSTPDPQSFCLKSKY